MEEIEVHPMWLEDEAKLMIRVANLIEGPTGRGPFKVSTFSGTDEYKWQLDGGNNYWARLNEGKLQLSSRYSGERFKVLAEFVRVWLGKRVWV